MPVHDSNQQEFFSQAVVFSIVSASGFNILMPRVDRKKLDFTIEGDSVESRINVQLKSTTVARFSRGALHYTLDRATYDILRVPSSSPFWLVVVVLPRDVRRWASHSKASLILRRCTYWHSLEGYPEIITESATVRIPEEQRFTVECLQATMLALESTP